MLKMPVPLSKKDADLCIALGATGIAITLLALFQHLFIMIPFWITYLMILIYCTSLFAFICLVQKKKIAPFLLIFSSIILVLLLLFQLISSVFSLIVIILTIYSLVVTVFLFISELPVKLKNNYNYNKNEKDYWANKL